MKIICVFLVFVVFEDLIIADETGPCLCPSAGVVPASEYDSANKELYFCVSKTGQGGKMQGTCENSGLYLCSGPDQTPKMIQTCDKCRITISMDIAAAAAGGASKKAKLDCKKDGKSKDFITAASASIPTKDDTD